MYIQKKNYYKNCIIFLIYSRYYLKKYGSPSSLIKFWMKHHLLEDACSFVFTNSLPIEIFIKDIFQYCLSHSILNDLQNVIKKLGKNIKFLFYNNMIFRSFFSKE